MMHDPIKLLLICLTLTINQFSCLTTLYGVPEDCTSSPAPNFSESVLLKCNIRTINGAFESTNLGLIPSHRTVALTLSCDNILFESSLTNGSLSHLGELRSLTIERCKFDSLPSGSFIGLTKLTNLTLRTYNGDWSRSLNLNQGLLQTTRSLERIDLAYNGLTSLPEKLFCSLSSLNSINLSHNLFSEVTSIGFSTRKKVLDRAWTLCTNNSTGSLDLSHNRLKVLTERGFATLSHLRVIRLNNNLISRAEESSLIGLSELTLLDLSNNELVALPPRFFTPIKESLRELYLQNNSISVLPPGQFNGLRSVRLLNISHNEITNHWINPDTFADLVSLVMLDLSYNRLKKIDSSTFRSQSSLQILQLHHNEIESLADNAFSSLYNLQTLVLSHNHLSKLDSAECFNGLNALPVLYLDHNRIELIHSEIFRNLTHLMELNLSYNWFNKAVPGAMSWTHSLSSLDLSYNYISDIGNASYQGNGQLYSLNLEGNKIGNLSRGVFADLPFLRIINLAKNQIESIEEGTFTDVPDLHALRLDSNGLSNINELFTNLRDLLMLNISANKIVWFDYAHIPYGLQWLDIHDNLIDSLENHYELESSLKLITLDASSNRITHLSKTSLPNGIEVVLLNNNSILQIEPSTFLGKQNLTRVDLTSNRLTVLEQAAFRLSKVPLRRPLPEFNISKNPFRCDCTMEWLQQMATTDDESRQYPKIVDVAQIMCEFAFKKQISSLPLTHAESSNFLCQYKSHCYALCHCCEFDACDCEMICPENCTCYYGQSWNTHIVDCSSRRHSVVPPRIPMDATELYLDGNDIPVLSSNTFIGRKNMKVLHLNNSNIYTINNRTFNGLTALEILNLSHNRLVTLYGYEFERLVNLTELYLDHNRISSIANNTFAALTLLTVLHLDHNYIVDFELWNLNINSRLTVIQLAGNPWSCECHYVEPFLDWVHSKSHVISDSRLMECYYNETAGLPLLPKFNISTCTNFSARKMLAQRFQVENFVPIVVISVTLLVIFVFICVVMLIYRREVNVWFYSRYGVRLQGRSVNKREEEKLYDAFISYSKKDEAFVSQILAPELEYGSPGYRLCLHFRDLPVASGCLSDAIVAAMEASQRVVIVLSENFLKGEWCRYEFRSAHLEVLRTSRSRLIILCIGKINSKDLDPDIRFWLKTTTFLQWGEKLFWEKLRYAMPDIAYTRKQPADQTRDLNISVHV